MMAVVQKTKGLIVIMQRIRIALPLIVSFFVLSLEHTAFGAQGIIIQGSTTSSMGGAGRAGTEVGETIFLNPASIGLSTGFTGSMLYNAGSRGEDDHETGFGVALVENDKENALPGGFAYAQTRRMIPGQGMVNDRYILGAFGKRVYGGFAIGASLFWNEKDRDRLGVSTSYNGSVGALWAINSNLGFAWTFSNLAGLNDELPPELQMVPQQAIGIHYLIPEFMRVTVDLIRWEAMNPEKKGIVQAGMEFSHGRFLLSRLGFQVDDISKANHFSLGVGFNGPVLKINYAFTRATEGAGGALHGVDMQVPF